ncbi:MAG: hypothetical protein ABJM06_02980 [Gilvibacter sp.]
MEKTKSPHFSDGSKLLDVYESRLGTLYFYQHLVIGEFHEGVNLSYQNAFNILLKSLKYIGTRPIVYISNRVNSYSVQPNDYKYLEKVPNIKGIAIVSSDSSGTSSAMLEAKFVNKNFALFSTIQEAQAWGMNILAPYFTKSK